MTSVIETPESILQFWFGSNSDDAATVERQSRLWWKKDERTDAIIRERFERCVLMAARGELDAWSAAPRGRLALIILTDQFPRNIYRGTAQAFAFDVLARTWCKEGIRIGAHEALRPIERVFFFLPLEHSESMDDQEQAIALFRELAENADARHKAAFDGFLDFALRHRDIIARFGRFPHRNRILRRESSPQEQEFLLQPGSGF
jgi:uncharacterized protein (DUF924 family)